MLKNYLKIVFRNVLRNKVYSFINIVGLAIGMACSILIFFWVQDELSYDRFHKNSATLCGAYFSNGSPITPPALAKFLTKQYPEIVDASRFNYVGRIKVQYGEKAFMENGGRFVDPAFIDMFTLEFISGNPETAFKQPLSVVITESFAMKYFTVEDPVGKTLTAEGMDFKVDGVIKDYPQNSHIQFDFLLPFALLGQIGQDLNAWSENWHRTFVQLHENVSLKELNKKVVNVVRDHREQDQRSFLLRPITEIYLYRLNGGGRIIFVYTFSAIAFFILLIACINFMNLSTAQSAMRTREVGMRKAVGASRYELVKQFFSETFVFIFIAWLMGIMVMGFLLPEFNELTGKEFSLPSLAKLPVLSGIIGILVLTGILAGSYPALILSSYKPATILRGIVRRGAKGSLFRKGLVVFQFTLSIILIFSTLVLYQQLDFLRTTPLGFDKDFIVTMRIGDRVSSVSSFKNSLYENPNIVKITTTNIPPYRWNTNAGLGDVHWEGQEHKQISMVETTVDHDYAEAFGLQIVNGRFLSQEYPSDATDAWVVNEEAVRAMGMDSPVEKWLRLWDDKRKIIGVVKDFHYESLHSEIMPMAMRISQSNPWACIKIRSDNVQGTLKFMEKKWSELCPEYPFEYHFLDDQINEMYMSDQRISRLFQYFTLLAIIISCLGLFGLASFFAQERTKEIGIRKVLGASVSGLLLLLSRDFIKWVLVATLIALPLAWFAMTKFLQVYAYRISIGLSFFLVSGVLALVIAFLTVSYQSIKAAAANPVESLRYE